MVWAGQIKDKMTAEKDGDISGHLIISCKEMMQEERKQKTSGPLLISFPLQARDGGSCRSEATSGDVGRGPDERLHASSAPCQRQAPGRPGSSVLRERDVSR